MAGTRTSRYHQLIRSCLVAKFSFLFTLFLLAHSSFTQGSEGDKAPIIGISFGNSYSYVGVAHNKSTTIIPNQYGQRGIPSWVSFTNTGESLVGEAAMNRSTTHPEQTLFGFQHLLGRNHEEVRQFASDAPFKIVDKEGLPIIEVPLNREIKTYSPESISALLLEQLKGTAEAYLNKTISEAIIAVPFDFTERQRAAVKKAGSIAGLHIPSMINDPTSAGVAYNIDHSDALEHLFLVVDIGGSTTSISVVIMEMGVFEILGIANDRCLGGDTFNQEILKYLQDRHERLNDLHPGLLERKVEQAKRILSIETETNITMQDDSHQHNIALARQDIEIANSRHFAKVMHLIEEALRDSNRTKYDINEVVFSGGSTRIPKIQQLVADYFPPNIINQNSIDPEEVAVHGAARQGAILAGDNDFIWVGMYDDILPLTLGVATSGGLMKPVIKRGAMLPQKRSKVVTTSADHQISILVVVHEGERALAANNKILGAIEIDGIEPAPRGVPKIEVQFTVEPDGVLTVEAFNLANNHKQSLRIPEPRFHTEDVDERIEEAELYSEQDEELRRRIENNMWNEIEVAQGRDTQGIVEWEEDNHDEL